MLSAAYISKHGLKWIIGLKILVLTFILYDSGFFYVGDRSLIGQEDGSEQREGEPEREPSRDLASRDQGPRETNQRGYLDNLLNLPKIDSEELKKDELGKYFAILERKKVQVEERIKVLENREETLKRLERSVEEKIEKLESEIMFFQQTQQKEKKIKDDRLEQLVAFYQKMTPKKAAPVFEEMDRDLVVQLFNKIPQKQTMNILSLMDPAKSVEITEYYGRIRSAKEYELLKEVNTALLKEFEQCKNP